jgi:trans-aconitate 2-methyltransferase
LTSRYVKEAGMPVWDPQQYARFEDDRARPFVDLMARVQATQPGRVVDLGCGPGTLTASLRRRWPGAEVVGVDSSPEMVARALTLEEPGLTFVEADLRGWVASAEATAYDVVVSNATLQWVPDHLDLLPALVGLLTTGGWLAVQIPGNHDAPSHTVLRDLAAHTPYAAHTAGVAVRPDLPGAQDYLERLSALGCRVDAWETTYLHVLPGEDPVFEWVSGTGARPVLQALPDHLREDFVRDYRRALREAYPRRAHGTVLPFRRVFAVARRG